MATQSQVIIHVPALNARVKKIISAFAAEDKARAAAVAAETKIGDVVLSIAPTLKADDVEPFCKMVHNQLDAARPEKTGSNKTQVSYIRRVLTAVVKDGVTVEPGQSLRGIYESLRKKKTGGNTHAGKGAKLPNPAEKTADNPAEKTADNPAEKTADNPAEKTATLESRAEKVKAAVTMIFGYCEPDLLSAVQHAASNDPAFLEWAENMSQSAMLDALEKAITPRKQATKTAKSKAAA